MDDPQKSIRMRPGRSGSPCPPECPGCAHQHASDAESRFRKQQWLERKLAQWVDRLHPIAAAPGNNRFGYRRKVCLAAAWETEKWHFGLHFRKRVLAIHRCPAHAARIRAAAALFSRRLPPFSAFPLVYFVQSDAQITLVLKSGRLPDPGWLDPVFAHQLKRAGIEGLWLNLHPSAGRRIFSNSGWHLVWGIPRSVDADGLMYGPTAFQQQIPALYRKALDQAEAFLKPTEPDLVIDLYCGIGASLRRWSELNCAAAGVELGGEAVECATENAPGASILRGRCRERIPQLNQWISKSARDDCRCLLFVNPPRTGLEPEITDWITQSYKPDHIAYLSCSAGTLNRDLSLLETAGYRIESIFPYDFFPGTLHVESLVCLQRTG